jgi:hypothetical protein
MDEEKFTGLVFECIYVGIQPLTVTKEDSVENRVLLYFSREPDSAEVPLSITETQAQQLYEDLDKVFQKSG